jgi:hypothetical protein
LSHGESSPALHRGPYADRWKTWPPEGFVEPTPEELSAVIHRLRNPSTWSAHLLRRKTTGGLLRHLQVIDWFHDRPELNRSHDYTHALRRETSSRKDVAGFVSLRHDRCAMCSHASDRLWEATGQTHSITDRDGEPIKSVFVCARCWSDYLIINEE